LPTTAFSAASIDDLLNDVLREIEERGSVVTATRGTSREIVGVTLELSNPCARISRTEARGKLFSGLGELMWYLSGSNEVAFVAYYISKYRDDADGHIVLGGYGPRLFGQEGSAQVDAVLRLLRKRPSSRQAVIQLFSGDDLVRDHKSIPCTCCLQFLIRDGALHLMAYLRSNDVVRGLPHDIFCFTMLQEIMARTLGVQLGYYKHFVGSLHRYVRDEAIVRVFLDEGYQPTSQVMPPMPTGDPWRVIGEVLAVEQALRGGETVRGDITRLGDYWADIVRLLQIYRCRRDGDKSGIRDIAARFSWKGYMPFAQQFLDEEV
jgi:thymidylate synthase